MYHLTGDELVGTFNKEDIYSKYINVYEGEENVEHCYILNTGDKAREDSKYMVLSLDGFDKLEKEERDDMLRRSVDDAIWKTQNNKQ